MHRPVRDGYIDLADRVPGGDVVLDALITHLRGDGRLRRKWFRRRRGRDKNRRRGRGEQSGFHGSPPDWNGEALRLCLPCLRRYRGGPDTRVAKICAER